MAVALLRVEIGVTNRLHELGLTRAQLLEVVAAMVGARADATENDPPMAASWSSWRMGTRRARDVLRPTTALGRWERDESGQISSVVNKLVGVRVIVSNTDDGTCEDSRHPQNRSRKGAGTDQLVFDNQLSFLDALDSAPSASSSERPASKPIQNWYLCVYNQGDDVRAELSCPTLVDNGFFADFRERIEIVNSGDDWLERLRRAPSDGDDGEFNIQVSRK